MEKEDVEQRHYELPAVSGLENSVARQYLKAYSSVCYFVGFGDFLFVERAAPDNVKDEGNPAVESHKYDTAFMELYSLALAKAEIEASASANAENALDCICQVKVSDDFFLGELVKRDAWQKYVHPESIIAWYDDKRRAALRGLAKKGLFLQEKAVPKEDAAIPKTDKQKRHWPLYALVVSNLVVCAGIAASQFVGYLKLKKFEEKAESLEYRVNDSVSKLEQNLEPEHIFRRAELYLRSDSGQEQANRLYVEFKDWWKKEDLAVDQFDKFWEDKIKPVIEEFNSPESDRRRAKYIVDTLEGEYGLKTTVEEIARIFGKKK